MQLVYLNFVKLYTLPPCQLFVEMLAVYQVDPWTHNVDPVHCK